jgi:hypothetical protein
MTAKTLPTLTEAEAVALADLIIVRKGDDTEDKKATIQKIKDAFALGTAASENIGTSGANVPRLNGGNTYSGASTFTNQFNLSGTTNTNIDSDQASIGFGNTTFQRWNITADVVISGMINPSIGRVFVVGNTGTHTAVIKHDTGITSSRRFLLPDGKDIVLRPNDYIFFYYAPSISRWVAASKSSSSLSVDTITGNYTLNIFDAGKYMTVTAASGITIPTNAEEEFSIGTQITFFADTDGEVTIEGEDGVTVKSAAGHTALDGQNASGVIVKVAEDTWHLFGALKAAT